MSSVVGAAAPVDEGLPAAAGAVAEDAETAAPGTGDAVGSAEASAAVSSAPVGKGLPIAAAAAATEDSEMAAPGSAPGTGDAVGNAEALSAAAADDAEESGSGSDSGAASEPEDTAAGGAWSAHQRTLSESMHKRATPPLINGLTAVLPQLKCFNLNCFVLTSRCFVQL
jgi:hypothetical protein